MIPICQKYDLIVDFENIIWSVVSLLSSKYVVAHPKYVIHKTNSYKRVSNPFSPTRDNVICFPKTIKIGKHDYLFPISNINKTLAAIPCCDIVDSGTRINSIARSLKDQLGVFLNTEDFGFTGSILLGIAKDDYSDIDIVMTENAYKRFLSHNNNIALQKRTTKEWIEFYDKMGILTSIDAKSFAKAQLDKCNQFKYAGVNVSIFIRPAYANFPFFSSFEINQKKQISITGECLVSEMNPLPGFMIIHSDGINYVVINFHRTYQASDYIGRVVFVKGILVSSEGLIIVNYNEYDAIYEKEF